MSETGKPSFRAHSPGRPNLEISVARQGDDCRLNVRGELDMETATYLQTVFGDLSSQPGHSVVVDMSSTTFCDCAGLAVLVAEHRNLRRKDVDLVIENPPRMVVRLLTLTKLADVLPVRRSGPTVD